MYPNVPSMSRSVKAFVHMFASGLWQACFASNEYAHSSDCKALVGPNKSIVQHGAVRLAL